MTFIDRWNFWCKLQIIERSETDKTREVIPANTRMDGCRHSRVSSRKLSTLYATNDLYVKTRQQHTTTELTGDSADATNNGYYATRTDTQDIARSPLAKLLFAIDGVKAVYLGPEKKEQKKRNANPTHVHVPGVDPSQDDIARARELQQIKPPKCDQAYQR